MKRAENGCGDGRPARKTVLAVISVAIIGSLSLCVWYLQFADKTQSVDIAGEKEPALGMGPLPSGAQTTPPEAKEELPRLSRKGAVLEPRQPLEGVDKGTMSSFFGALGDLDRGARKLVRILHYGDSILTTDQLSGTVRRILQKRFGDGGHGFVLLGKPWRWYSHLDVTHGARGKWRGRPITSDPVRDGLYGLGGVGMEPQRASHGRAWAGASSEGEVGGTVASFELSYLAQPHGGSFELKIDERTIETVSTQRDELEVVHRVFDAPKHDSKLEVKYNNDGPVRLFGVVLESGMPGIVYDSLAINGARASVLGRYNIEHWKTEMELRDPSLVVLMFGANEGANRSLVLKEYRVHLKELIRTIRSAVPDASVLVVGPLDQAKRNGDGTFDSWQMPRRLSEAQREVALAEGCAFFDTWTAMGGRGSMGKWYRHGLGGGDLIHPTEQGARKIGAWLAEALLHGYYSWDSSSLSDDSLEIDDAGSPEAGL